MRLRVANDLFAARVRAGLTLATAFGVGARLAQSLDQDIASCGELREVRQVTLRAQQWMGFGFWARVGIRSQLGLETRNLAPKLSSRCSFVRLGTDVGQRPR